MNYESQFYQKVYLKFEASSQNFHRHNFAICDKLKKQKFYINLFKNDFCIKFYV